MIRVLHCSLLVILAAAVDGVCGAVLAHTNPYPAGVVGIATAVVIVALHHHQGEYDRTRDRLRRSQEDAR